MGGFRGPRRAIVFGEALIDVFPDATIVAGAPLHVAAHLTQTGWQVDFISRVGADRDGGRVVAALRSLGIDTSSIEMDHDLPTGRAEVLPHGRFTIRSPAAYDEIDGPDEIGDHSLFVYGTLASRSEISRATLLRLLRQSRGLRALDLNLRSPYYTRATISSLIARAHLIKMTIKEMSEVAGLLGIAPTPTAFFQASRALTWVCLTKGAAGAELFSSSGRAWSKPAPAVDVVDSVGAGDAFFARLVGALAAGFSEEAGLSAATAAAAESLVNRGGLPRP